MAIDFINTFIKNICLKVKHKKCNHLFDPPDMQSRDENGNVHWGCCLCHKEFIAPCGLDILKHGKCTGRWGEPFNNTHH